MTVSQIKLALDNHWITSQTCVNQLLQRINGISPVNTPHVVNDYQGLQTFPGLNAYVYLNPNLVQQAIQEDQLRASGVKKPLLGVPIAIKDTIPVLLAGYPNSSGNLYLSNQYLPPNNDPGIQRLLDAGAILIGQNNQHEFGSGLTGINFSYGPPVSLNGGHVNHCCQILNSISRGMQISLLCFISGFQYFMK